MRNSVFIGFMTLVFGYVCLEHGGVTSPEWGYVMLAVLLAAAALWMPERGAGAAPALHPVLAAALGASVLLVALQLLPLPDSLLAVIDPARAGILAGLNGLGMGVSHSAPLSVAPLVTFAHLERLLTYVTVFLISRELGWRDPQNSWGLTIPVVAVGSLEGLLGLVQFLSGAARETGTYVNPNHFATLMHVALPLAVMAAVRAFRRRHEEIQIPARRVVFLCLMMACSAVILVGAVFSLSRMGLLTLLAAGAVMGFLGFLANRRGSFRKLAAAAPVAIVLLIALAAPGRLAERFSQDSGVSAEARLQFWKETTHLIAAYPLLGCGLGTYASAIQKFRDSAPLNLLDFAHNDYLQLLAELGLVGFMPMALAGVWIFAQPWRAAFQSLRSRHRLLAVACAASLTAIALDCLVDFDFYVPANVMAAAWIAGIAMRS